MLSGESAHNLDAKYRVIIPAKFREELGDTCIVTKGTDKCLNVFSAGTWEKFLERLETLPRGKDARDYLRHMVGSAEELNPDKMGRILLSSALRQYAGIEKEAVLIGVLDRVEIWDRTAWETRSREVSERVEQIADTLAEEGYMI